MRRDRRPFAAGVVVVLVSTVAAVGVAAPAGAITTGPCQVTVQGTDVRPLPVDDPDAAIHVDAGGTITYAVTAPVAVQRRNLVLSFAGVDVTVDSDTSTGTAGGVRDGAVAVDDYAWMGAGLYQVAGVGHLADGRTCSGAVLLDIGGSPLGSVAGVVGLILTILGATGIIVGAIRQGGGRLVRDLIDDVELSGTEALGGLDATAPATPVTPVATPTIVRDETDEPSPAAPGGDDRAASSPPPAPGIHAAATAAAVGTAGVAGAPTVTPPDALAVDGEAAPPPFPGMATVATVGTTSKQLSEATEQLQGHIDELPISDEQKEKLKETLGTGTIKEKLDAINEVAETVQHFEAMGTETVDKMNRWGVNANGINGLLWLRTMIEASGRLGQKFTDGLVTPVLEPVAGLAKSAGVEGVDAGEVAKALLPVQEFAEEASKASVKAAEHVLGGDNGVNQIGEYEANDEEWRNIREFR